MYLRIGLECFVLWTRWQTFESHTKALKLLTSQATVSSLRKTAPWGNSQTMRVCHDIRGARPLNNYFSGCISLNKSRLHIVQGGKKRRCKQQDVIRVPTLCTFLLIPPETQVNNKRRWNEEDFFRRDIHFHDINTIILMIHKHSPLSRSMLTAELMVSVCGSAS